MVSIGRLDPARWTRAANKRPSREKLTASRDAGFAHQGKSPYFNDRTIRPESISVRRNSPATPPRNGYANLPSGLGIIQSTSLLSRERPVSRSQRVNRYFSSACPKATAGRPPGAAKRGRANGPDRSFLSKYGNERSSRPVSASQSRRKPSFPAVTTRFPSGQIAPATT